MFVYSVEKCWAWLWLKLLIRLWTLAGIGIGIGSLGVDVRNLLSGYTGSLESFPLFPGGKSSSENCQWSTRLGLGTTRFSASVSFITFILVTYMNCICIVYCLELYWHVALSSYRGSAISLPSPTFKVQRQFPMDKKIRGDNIWLTNIVGCFLKCSWPCRQGWKLSLSVITLHIRVFNVAGGLLCINSSLSVPSHSSTKR